MGMSFRTLFMLLVLAIGGFVGYNMLSSIGKRNDSLGKLASLASGSTEEPPSTEAMDANDVALVEAVHAGDSLLQKLVVPEDIHYVAAAIVQAGTYGKAGQIAELNSVSVSLKDRLSYVGEACDVIAVMESAGTLLGRQVDGGMEISGRCAGSVPPGIRDSKTLDLSPVVSIETFRKLGLIEGDVTLGRKNSGALGVEWSIPVRKDSID